MSNDHRFAIGDTVRIKLHDKVMTVTARPSPGKYVLFGAAGRSLTNVPEELIEPAQIVAADRSR